MTTGERIKYLRKLAKLSGAELSKLSGISHTIIRKYETNRGEPKEIQIFQIAEALNVNTYAITKKAYHYRFKTVGDLFGIIFMLYKSGFLRFDGIRNIDNKLCSEIKLSINPLVEQFITGFYKDSKSSNIQDFNFFLNNSFMESEFYEDFLCWEMYNDKLNTYVERFRCEHCNETGYINEVKRLNKIIEEHELILLYNQEELYKQNN